MPACDGTYDHYHNVVVGLQGIQSMLEAMGCWSVVQDVSTSNVLKPAGHKEQNLALMAKFWSKVGLANFRCMDHCTTKVAELLEKYPFYMMHEEPPPLTLDAFLE